MAAVGQFPLRCRLGFDSINVTYVSATRLIIFFLCLSLSLSLGVALVGVTHLLLWIVVWLCLSIKRRWHFKLPPLDHTYGGLLNKASAQPLLMSSGQRTGSNSSSGANSTSTTVNGGDNCKPDMMSTATSTELGGMGSVSVSGMGMSMGLVTQEDIYWPKLTPSSPKLKVTFNEVTSTSDDVLLIGDQEQTDGKR